MNRVEALEKLIQVEPITAREIVAACGWPDGEAIRVLTKLVEQGRVRYVHIGCGQRLYFVGRSAADALRRTGQAAGLESLRVGADQRHGKGRAGNVGRMACAAGGGGQS
jgi:DNA-binding IclR family transcriptional regulator